MIMTNKAKVLLSVVVANAVKVMDNLVGMEWSSEFASYNQAVFFYPTVVCYGHGIEWIIREQANSYIPLNCSIPPCPKGMLRSRRHMMCLPTLPAYPSFGLMAPTQLAAFWAWLPSGFMLATLLFVIGLLPAIWAVASFLGLVIVRLVASSAYRCVIAFYSHKAYYKLGRAI